MPTAVIYVCVCTFRRTALLQRLFEKLARQQTGGQFELAVAVVDNDCEASAKTVVAELAVQHSLRVAYEVEPERNLALARNRVVRLAKGDYVAFIDDDEVPVEDWLLRLRETLQRSGADGVLGPVRPYFDETPPRWLVRSRLCERPAHPTGLQLDWTQTRTGNVLLKRSLFEEEGIWFDARFATGGEDVDFFKRAMQAGGRFVWCEEAAAYELVSAERLRTAYYLKRALLLGSISWKHAEERAKLAVKTFLAIPIYGVALPFLLLGGLHLFMRFLIKECHHVGRALAMAGITPIRSRDALVSPPPPKRGGMSACA